MSDGSTLNGFAFPFRIDPRTGGVAVTAGPHKLTENLEHLLLTRTGERLMTRDYGGGVTALLHENVNDALVAIARQQVGQAMLRFEPRALPQDIAVIPRGAELWLRVHYLQAEEPGVQTSTIQVG